MMQKIILFVLIGLSFQTWAQNPSAIKYANYLTAESARKHLSILASDEFGGRETGTKGAEMAANYIAAEFKKIGLKAPVKDSYFQNVELISSTFTVDKFQVNNQHLENLKHFYFPGSANDKKIKAEKIVFAGYGISTPVYDDLKGIDITGKVVLILGGNEPVKNGVSVISGTAELSEWSSERSKRIQNLQSKNPALILIMNSGLAQVLAQSASHKEESIISLKKAATISPAKRADIIQVTSETANVFLKKSGKTIEQLSAAINTSGQPSSQSFESDFEVSYGTKVKDVKGANVLGYLEGSDLKDELLVISAHYDHVGLNPDGPDKVYNGADDDGSGTTAVIELARMFSQAKKAGKGPRRSILFLAVVGEEKGLLGSQWYSNHPVFPLKNTVANLNIDMIGRVDPAHKEKPEYCYLIGSDKLSTQLHQISENANATYTKLQIDYKYNDPQDPERIYYRSDHYNFAKHGIPIIFYFNGVHEDYHKVSDEVSKINFPLLVKRAQLVFYTAWDIVNRDKRPLVDVVDNMPKIR
ncbi:MAG: M28 family peptidase [Sphingobacteriaceae bacterium]